MIQRGNSIMAATAAGGFRRYFETWKSLSFVRPFSVHRSFFTKEKTVSEDQQTNQVPQPQVPAAQLTFLELLRIVITDPRLDSEQKKTLLDELRKSGGVDRWTYRSAIWILGGVILLTIVAISLMTTVGGVPPEQIPQGLVAIGSSAVGGLAGLLTPGPEHSGS
jgi:hypothetical protein